MALGFFNGSFLGGIGRMLPWYIKGREEAIDKNWSDRKNYKTAMKCSVITF